MYRQNEINWDNRHLQIKRKENYDYEKIYLEFYGSDCKSLNSFIRENYPQFMNKDNKQMFGNHIVNTKGWTERKEKEKKELLEKAKKEIENELENEAFEILKKVKKSMLESIDTLSNTLISYIQIDKNGTKVYNRNDIIAVEKIINILRPYIGDVNGIDNKESAIELNEISSEIDKLKGF